MLSHRERDRLLRAAREARPADMPTVQMPNNIIEFAVSPKFLGLELYPKQATLLKVITLALSLFTDFDHRVLARWAAGFEIGADADQARYRGAHGIVPDVLERIEWCRSQGRPWFREVVLVMGRRGSKNFLASILLAWRLWHLLALGDPQAHYRIPKSKTLAVHSFGTDQMTLRRNAFGDIAGLLRDAPCFAPFLGAATTTSITLLTPAQLAAGARPHRDPGTISVVAAATTFTSARGPAAPVLLFDEFAFVQGAGTTATSTDIYRAATPAVMQFHNDALIIQISSPWEQTGQLYDSYLRGLAVDPTTSKAKDPGTLVVQLPSWELYEHDEPAESIPMWPGGPSFVDQPPKITRAQVGDLEAQGVEVAVEYLAQFATTRHAYLRPDKVQAIFGPWKGQPLYHQHIGRMDRSYFAHADPSRSNANFAFAIGHREVDDQDRTHVVFDLLRVWRPEEFPDGIIDYPTVENEIFRYIEPFRLREVTFDQYNSTQSIQQLNRRVQAARFQWRCLIHELTATASHNFRASEAFKTAVNAGLVHAPHHDLAQQELLYLVEEGTKVTHPRTGPVQTDDLADAMINVTYTLLHRGVEDVFEQLGATRVSASWPRDRDRGTPQEQLSELTRALARREAPPHNPARGRRPPGRFGRS